MISLNVRLAQTENNIYAAKKPGHGVNCRTFQDTFKSSGISVQHPGL